MKLGRGNLPDSLEICENPPVVTEHGQVPPRSPEGVTGAPLDHRRTGEFGKGEDLETLRVDGGEAPVPGPAVHLHPPGLFGLCSSLPFSLVLQKQNYFIRYIAMTSQLKILTLAAVVVGGRGGGVWMDHKKNAGMHTDKILADTFILFQILQQSREWSLDSFRTLHNSPSSYRWFPTTRSGRSSSRTAQLSAQDLPMKKYLHLSC